MNKNVKNICREFLISIISVYSETIQPFLGTLTLLNFLPALLYGCSGPEPLQAPLAETTFNVSVTRSGGQIEEADIFVFKDDRLQKLDCYQKISRPRLWNEKVVSSYGDRIIAVCANSGRTSSDWAFVSSLPSLAETTRSLEDESLASPFMFGARTIAAGKSNREISVHLRPLFSIVELRTLSCDFSGRPYSGERLSDVKIYLTNVNAVCRISEEGEILPSRIINAGELCKDDMDMFEEPALLFRQIEGDVGKNALYTDISLICYPNNSREESPGTPFTRLVIEGKLSGQTFYWPIDINRENGGKGISINERYIYDIRITRKGSSDPDIPVKTEAIDIKFEIEKWEERKDCSITF